MGVYVEWCLGKGGRTVDAVEGGTLVVAPQQEEGLRVPYHTDTQRQRERQVRACSKDRLIRPACVRHVAHLIL